MGEGLAPPPWKKTHATKTLTRIQQNISDLGEDGPPPGGDMMRSGESLNQEATPRTTIISTKTTTNIGAWNVRTMFQTGKTAQVAAEMRRYHLAILGISEARWNGAGKFDLRTGEQLLYSGHQEKDAPHEHGVALMLSKQAKGALIGWEAHGPRIIRATFRTGNKRINMEVVQAYAPQEDSKVEDKEEFYHRLESVIQGRPTKNLQIVMGDFNAQIGSENRGFEEVMGIHCEGVMKPNGEMFVDMCATNNLVIGGSIFKHKTIHKRTWVSNDGVTENQIDHICIGRTFRRSLEDVRVRRGADVGSDHHLVVGKLRLKLKRKWIDDAPRRRNFDVNKLKDETRKEEFKVAVSNRFEALQNLDGNEDIEQNWKAIKESVTSACQEILGPRKYNHKEWITQDTLKLVEERREKKAKINSSRTRGQKAEAREEYAEADRKVKRSAKEDKRKYMDSVASEAEQASYHGNMKELYSSIKKLSGKFKSSELPVKDKNGDTLSTEEAQMGRWREHFEELLNRPAPQNPPMIQPSDTDLPISCDYPSKDEIRRAIKQMKGGKASGPDSIPQWH